jgi:multidrug resistance efflux pump
VIILLQRSFAKSEVYLEALGREHFPVSEKAQPIPTLQPAVPSDSEFSLKAEQLRPRKRTWQIIRPAVIARIGLATLALGVAGTYLYDRFMLNVSIDAIVNAQLTPIRSPIEGRVSLSRDAQPGSSIEKGAALFTVVADRPDERNLAELKSGMVGLTEAARLVDGRITSLQALNADLLLRISSHREATVNRLKAMIAEVSAVTEGARAKVTQNAEERRRAEELLKRGVISKAKVDENTAEEALANAEVSRLRASTLKLITELGSAQKGIMIGDGYSDSPYSLQRVDELRMRLWELVSERAAVANNERQLKDRIVAEERRLDQLTQDIVSTSTSGILWNIRVGEGAWVSRGDTLADFADCSQSFVEATLPERGLASVRPGDPVNIRLFGSATNVDGVIRSVRGSGANVAHTHRAAGLDHLADGMMMVVVDVSSNGFRASGCQIGRSAKVYFNKGSDGLSLLSGSEWAVSALRKALRWGSGS